MESTIKVVNDAIVMTVQHETLDARTAQEFRKEFDSGIESGAQIVLDLSNVKFVDSAGLGAMVAALKLLRSTGGDMKVCGVHKPVLALFQLVRMHRLVEIFDDLDEALASGQ